MGLFLKTLLQRPFTYADLRHDADGFFREPPLPTDLRDSLASLRGANGESLLDYWRGTLEHDLRTIAGGPTWAAQRSALIRALLREGAWRALYSVIKECRFARSWEHLLEGNPIADVAQDKREGLVFQRYLLAVTTGACLLVLGQRRYGVDGIKVKECEAYYLFDREIKRLDVSVVDYAMSLAKNDDDESALAVAGFHDQHVAPIIDQQITDRSAAEEQVIHGSLDTDRLRRSLERVERQKSELVASLKALAG